MGCLWIISSFNIEEQNHLVLLRRNPRQKNRSPFDPNLSQTLQIATLEVPLPLDAFLVLVCAGQSV